MIRRLLSRLRCELSSHDNTTEDGVTYCVRCGYRFETGAWSECPTCQTMHLTAHPPHARPSDETGAWERLGDMLTEKHGESCDCDICLYVQPRVDAALAARPSDEVTGLDDLDINQPVWDGYSEVGFVDHLTSEVGKALHDPLPDEPCVREGLQDWDKDRDWCSTHDARWVDAEDRCVAVRLAALANTKEPDGG